MNRRELILNHLRRVEAAKKEADQQERQAELAELLVTKMYDNGVIFGLDKDNNFVIDSKKHSNNLH